MKLKNYFIIFCLFIVLIGCVGAISAASDDTINTGVSEIESGDDTISVENNNQVLGVGNESALSAQCENDDEISIYSTPAEEDSSDVRLSESGGAELYVSTDGSDDNDGTSESPFATIAKAISSTDASKDTIIYIGEGNFTGTGNTNLEINLPNIASGGSLTIMGIEGSTVIDGENNNRFINSIGSTSIVTVKNIIFNNTWNPDGPGGAINSIGLLTVDNCVFEDTYALYTGGAIYQWATNDNKKLTVTNSQFINTHVDYSGGGAIYAYTDYVEIINNTFINCINTYDGQGAAVYSYGRIDSKISGNKFYNITVSNYDASLYVQYSREVTNNTFINCHNLGSNYAVMYLGGAEIFSGNEFINSSSASCGLIYYANNNVNILMVKVNDVEASEPSFSLSANVTDIDGNSMTLGIGLSFFIDGQAMGNARIINGVSTLNVERLLDNGEYTISCKYNTIYFNPVWTNGTLTVNIDPTPLEVWVDAENGEDVETAGSDANPFKSISYAINQAASKSYFPTIHINNGVYSGENNTQMTINDMCTITFIGDNTNETIIDGEGSNTIFTKIGETTKAIFKNISFINGKGNNVGVIYSEGTLIIDNCIFKDDYGTNYAGAIYSYGKNIYNLEITNCKFINCTSTMRAGVVYANSMINIFFENNSIINCSATGNERWNPPEGMVRLNANNILVSNNQFIDNYVCFNGPYQTDMAFAIDLYVQGAGTINNNKFINSDSTGRSQTRSSLNVNAGNLNITNNEFINTENVTQGVLSLGDGEKYLENNTFTNALESVPNIFISRGTINGKIIVLNNTLNTHLFNLTANITDIDGNTISSGDKNYKYVHFFIDSEEIGQTYAVNGVATLECSKLLENGEHIVSCSFERSPNATLSAGTLIVNIEVNPKEYYISASEGDDENGVGSKSKPFKTLKKALDQAFLVDHSYDVIINVMDGTYSGEGNVNLFLNNSFAGALKIVGENYNEAIFNGYGDAHMFCAPNTEYYDDYAIPNVLKVSIENISFIDFAYDDDGSFIRSDASELNLTNCIFDTIYSASYRGTFINQLNDLNIKNSIFKNIMAENSYIIGIWISEGKPYTLSATMDNCTFMDCTGQSIANGIIELSNSQFVNCTAQGYNDNEYPIVWARTDATFANNEFINNTARGGVLRNDAMATITNNTFMGNKVSYRSTINSKGNLTLIDSKFINNTGNMGGAIYTNSALNLTNVVFDNNKQISVLNDIYAVSGAEISGLTLTFNDINANHFTNDFIAEISSADGAIITGGEVEFYVDGTLVGAGSVKNNNAIMTYSFGSNGKYILNGTYSLGGDDLIVNTGEAIINRSSSEFKDLYVSDSMGDDKNGNGSITSPFKTIKKAVYCSEGHDNVTIHVLEGIYKGMQNTNIQINSTRLTIVGEGKDKTIIDGENANYFFNIVQGNIIFSNLTFINGFVSTYEYDYYDYCIMVSDISSLVLDNVKYENNTEIDTADNEYLGILNYGLLTIINSEFNNNGNTDWSVNGLIGGVSRDSIIRIANSTFANDKGSQASSIFAYGEVSIDNCIFSNNSNSRYVINNNGGLTNVKSSIFTDNDAACIYGRVNVTNSNFTNNYAKNNQARQGAAIYGNGYVSNCTFINNTAGYGGAMQFRGEIYNCKFYNNTATNGEGGALKIDSGLQTTIENCYFEGNQASTGTASRVGGGAIANVGNTLIDSCTFVKNTAVQRGGAIRNGQGYDNAVLTVRNSLFIDNYAGNNGGAITSYMDESQYGVIGTINIYSSKFINNTAGVTAGAIEAFRTVAQIDDCLFEGNTALNGGALSLAAYWYGPYASSATITNCNFTKNNGYDGGAIQVKDTVNIYKSIFVDNNATTGGAIDSSQGSTEISYCVFVNNTAEEGSAVYDARGGAYLDNNWWGCNDDPNQFILSNWAIETWAVINLSPDNLSDIRAGDNIDFTVHFTDNNGSELTDTIPIRHILVYDDSYDLANNAANITVLAKAGTMILSVDNEAFEFNVSKVPTEINLAYDDVDRELTVTFVDNVTGQPLSGATLSVRINGVLTKVKTDSSGQAIVSTADLEPGTYTVAVSYNGGAKYNPSKTSEVIIVKADTALSVDYNDSGRELTVTFVDNVTGQPLGGATVSVKVNGVLTKVKTDSSGQAIVSTADLAPGTYTVAVSYNGGTRYNPSQASEIIIVKADTSISAVYDDDAKELIVTLTNDATGQPLGGATVSVRINGVLTKVKTDSSGQAIVSTADLEPGTYTATVSYNGGSKYNPSKTTEKIIVKADTALSVDYNDSGRELTVTFVDNATGQPIAGATVSVKVNGVLTKVKTDSSGQAIVSTADLAPGTYTATVSYNGGTRYNPSKTTEKITVKANATLSVDYSDVDRELTVTFVDNVTGQPIAGATLSVRINGVLTKVKTDSSGQAIVSTADLAPGTYTATVSYNGGRYNPSQASEIIIV